MMRIQGLSHEKLLGYIDELDAVAYRAIEKTLTVVAERMKLRAVIAAGPQEVDAVTTVTSPSAVSVDDLGAVYAEWSIQLNETVIPFIDEIIRESEEAVRAELAAGLGREVPAVSNVFTEQWLGDARNRLVNVSTEIWQVARDELVEGTLQGESIEELRDRVTGSINVSSSRATVIARTEVISASNAGSLRQVQVAGLTGTKEWLATNDVRTRESHRRAEGQSVDIDGVFTVGGYSLRFPGDPTGPAGEVINCRCTLVYDLSDDNVNTVTAAIDQDYSGLGMIALVPSAADIERLTITGGELPEELHLTLFFLGDITSYDPAIVTTIVDTVREISLEQTAIEATGFGVAVWNPTSDSPCTVMNVGGQVLEKVKCAIDEELKEIWSLCLPEQHSPWVPHIALAYTSDVSVLAQALKLTGPVVFDRIRIAFGETTIDVPLTSTAVIIAAAKEDDVQPAQELTQGTAWSGILCIEGVETGDGREFAPGSITWATPPLPLLWQRQTSDGHMGSVVAGSITNIERDVANSAMIRANGFFDDAGVDGAEALRQVRNKLLKGVSVDVDSIKESDIEYVFPPSDDVADPETDAEASDNPLDMLFGQAPEKMVFKCGRIRGATLVALPAFVEAQISLVDTPKDTIMPIPTESPSTSGTGEGDDMEEESILAGGELRPPDEWFMDPKFSGPTALTVDENGRVFGHAALFGSCHIGVQDRCIQPPIESQHDYFILGEVMTRSGETIPVGSITLGTGHAPTSGVSAQAALEHYDNTGTSVANVATGNDNYGIWVAGSITPGTSDERIAQLRSAKLSGDWRRIGGQLRLVALLAVNVPGFPVPRLSTRVASGKQMCLVASGIITDNDETHHALSTVRARLSSQVASRRREFVAKKREQLRGKLNVQLP